MKFHITSDKRNAIAVYVATDTGQEVAWFVATLAEAEAMARDVLNEAQDIRILRDRSTPQFTAQEPEETK